MIRFFKVHKVEAFLIGGTLFAILFSVFFNEMCRQVRIKELKIFLQRSAGTDNNIDHMGLLMKYRLHKHLYEKKIKKDDADLIEVSVTSMLSDLRIKKDIPILQYRYVAMPVLKVINFMRFLIGKIPIINMEDDKTNIYIEIGYYYERSRYYEKAINIYDTALDEGGLDRSGTAGILLHQGFCYSIIGDYKNARDRYITVINDYAEKRIAITAAVLLRYLEGFKIEIDRIKLSEKDSLSKGIKLYQLIAFKESLNVLKNIEKKIGSSEKSRFSYYKARCMEEVDDREQAIRTYQKIIDAEPASEYAKYANRRLFIIGMGQARGKGLREYAIKNNKVFQDNVLSRIVKESSSEKQIEKFNKKIEENELFDETLQETEKKYPMLGDVSLEINKSLEKAFKKDSKKQKVVKRRAVPAGGNTKIFLKSGDIYVGKVVKETGTHIFLKTVFGTVKISKKNTARRSR